LTIDSAFLPLAIFETIEYVYSKNGELSQDAIPLIAQPMGDAKRLLRKLDDLTPGEPLNLSGQRSNDALAVLYGFLKYLPEPIMGSSFASALMKFCWEPDTDIFTAFRIARLLLQTLPPVAFHGVIYVLSFLSQAPCIEGNRVDYIALSGLFGFPLLGSNRTSPTEAQGILFWLLENWGAISKGILDDTPLNQPASSPTNVGREYHNSTTPMNAESFGEERKRRYSRTGADAFPKLATIDDVSVADSSDLPRQQEVSSNGDTRSPGSNQSSPTFKPPTDFPEDKVTAQHLEANINDDKCLESRPLEVNPRGSSLDPYDYQELVSALNVAQRRVTELEVINNEQTKQLSQSRFALAQVQKEVAEAHLKPQQEILDQSDGILQIPNAGNVDHLKEELACAREERDTAMDVIEVIKGALKI